MKKMVICAIIIALIVIGILINYKNGNGTNNENFSQNIENDNGEEIVKEKEVEQIEEQEEKIEDDSKLEESEENMDNTIKVIIENKTYIANLEQNETVKDFLNMLPQEFEMEELHGNEKYIYLDTILPTNSYNPKHIEAGDIMLFCFFFLVVFYKSFDTTYSYTKIGHIENFDDLGNKDIKVKFEK